MAPNRRVGRVFEAHHSMVRAIRWASKTRPTLRIRTSLLFDDGSAMEDLFRIDAGPRRFFAFRRPIGPSGTLVIGVQVVNNLKIIPDQFHGPIPRIHVQGREQTLVIVEFPWGRVLEGVEPLAGTFFDADDGAGLHA